MAYFVAILQKAHLARECPGPHTQYIKMFLFYPIHLEEVEEFGNYSFNHEAVSCQYVRMIRKRFNGTVDTKIIDQAQRARRTGQYIRSYCCMSVLFVLDIRFVLCGPVL